MKFFPEIRQTVMLGTIIAFLTGCMHDIPKLGVENNRLKPCPAVPGLFRIVVLGDSFTFGSGVERDRT
ncbi:MAG: hypothetical protein R3207_04165, partial [Oceanospirillum sp.]|nr:hypothetical protein [Oceanospirillum sp.]